MNSQDKEAYNSIKDDFNRVVSITVGVARQYHSYKKYYSSDDGVSEIKENLDSKNFHDYKEIFTLSKGRVKLNYAIFTPLMLEFTSRLEFIIGKLDTKIRENSKDVNNYENMCNSYDTIRKELIAMKAISIVTNWNDVKELSGLQKTIKEFKDKYNPVSKMQL